MVPEVTSFNPSECSRAVLTVQVSLAGSPFGLLLIFLLGGVGGGSRNRKRGIGEMTNNAERGDKALSNGSVLRSTYLAVFSLRSHMED